MRSPCHGGSRPVRASTASSFATISSGGGGARAGVGITYSPASTRRAEPMDRRAFLALSAAAGAATRAAPRLPLQAPPPWYATMRRCGQLNFNERDPLTLDVAAWVD